MDFAFDSSYLILSKDTKPIKANTQLQKAFLNYIKQVASPRIEKLHISKNILVYRLSPLHCKNSKSLRSAIFSSRMLLDKGGPSSLWRR